MTSATAWMIRNRPATTAEDQQDLADVVVIERCERRPGKISVDRRRTHPEANRQSARRAGLPVGIVEERDPSKRLRLLTEPQVHGTDDQAPSPLVYRGFITAISQLHDRVRLDRDAHLVVKLTNERIAEGDVDDERGLESGGPADGACGERGAAFCLIGDEARKPAAGHPRWDALRRLNVAPGPRDELCRRRLASPLLQRLSDGTRA